MKATENGTNFAYSLEQELPERATLLGPPALAERRVSNARSSEPELFVTDLLTGASVRPASRETSLEATAESKLSPTILDRLEHSVLSEVKVIRQLKADSLAVVIKPDLATEILLRLSVREGQLEAHARCDRGDINALREQWGELQRSLADQGIRLAPLESKPPYQATLGGSLSNGSQHSQSGRYQSTEPGSLDELPLIGSLTEPLKISARRARPTPKRLLESWA